MAVDVKADEVITRSAWCGRARPCDKVNPPCVRGSGCFLPGLWQTLGIDSSRFSRCPTALFFFFCLGETDGRRRIMSHRCGRVLRWDWPEVAGLMRVFLNAKRAEEWSGVNCGAAAPAAAWHGWMSQFILDARGFKSSILLPGLALNQTKAAIDWKHCRVLLFVKVCHFDNSH